MDNLFDKLQEFALANHGIALEEFKALMEKSGLGEYTEAAESLWRDSTKANVQSWIGKFFLWNNTNARKTCKLLSEQETFPIGIDFDGNHAPYAPEEWDLENPVEGKRRIVLRLTSFRGISYQAEHYYASLSIEGNERIVLQRVLSAEDIASDRDRWYGFSSGNRTEAFELRSDIGAIVEGLKKWVFREDDGWQWMVEDKIG